LLIAVLAFGKYLQIKKLIASAPKPGAQVVTAIKVQAAEWQPQLNSVGTLAPVRGVDVTTEIAGLVREVRFKSGDEVKAGQVLFELNADSDVAQLRALQAAADLSGTTLKRDKLQLAAQAISQAQVDADEADLKSKQALVAQQKGAGRQEDHPRAVRRQAGHHRRQSGPVPEPRRQAGDAANHRYRVCRLLRAAKQLASLSIGQKLNLSSDAYPAWLSRPRSSIIRKWMPPPATCRCRPPCQCQAPAAAGHVRQRGLDQGDMKKIPDLAADGHYLQPVWPPCSCWRRRADAKDALKDEKGQPYLVAQQVFVTTGPTRGDQVAILTGVKEGQTVVTSGQLKLKNGTPA
jgi:membrane fusion protein (multidrug efflux system)